MILRFVLSDPVKSGLESSAWIYGYDYQNKHYHYEKVSPLFFSVQCIMKKKTCDFTIYILLFLPSWTTSWIF